jgi:hypothetical protein
LPEDFSPEDSPDGPAAQGAVAVARGAAGVAQSAERERVDCWPAVLEQARDDWLQEPAPDVLLEQGESAG